MERRPGEPAAALAPAGQGYQRGQVGPPGWGMPGEAMRTYGGVASVYAPRRMDPKEAEFENKSRELAGSLQREQDPAKKATIKVELQTAVAQQFQMRQQRRMEELTRLEEEVKKLRDAMEKREKGKDAIIAKRVAELTGEEDIGF
jgi:hypothetical protein